MIDILLQRCLDNKYTKWYINLCNRANSRLTAGNPTARRKEAIKILEFVEGHHILPRSIFPEFIKDKSNIVYLTYREHLIAHLLLCKMFPAGSKEKHKMQYATAAFSFHTNENQRKHRSINSRTFERLKMECSKIRSEMSSGENNPNYGGKITSRPEVRQKMRESQARCDKSNMGRWERTEEYRKKISEKRKGQITGDKNPMKKEEFRNKVGASKIGRKIATHRETGQRKYVFPDNVPEGFQLNNNS